MTPPGMRGPLNDTVSECCVSRRSRKSRREHHSNIRSRCHRNLRKLLASHIGHPDIGEQNRDLGVFTQQVDGPLGVDGLRRCPSHVKVPIAPLPYHGF